MADLSTARALARTLDGSRLVIFDEELDLVFRWNGSLTVNATDLTGQDVDVRTLGEVEGDPTGAYNLVDEWREELR